MKSLPSAIALAFVSLVAAVPSARAAVFVCSNEGCSAWTAITAAQQGSRSGDGENTTVQNALANSAADSVRNGVANVAGTNLYIKKFWHKGGNQLFDRTYEHVTVEVWKGNDYQKTCHAYSFTIQPSGRNQATCQ